MYAVKPSTAPCIFRNFHFLTPPSSAFCLGLRRTFSASFLCYFSINQCPSSLNSLTSFPLILQMYLMPTPPAFNAGARRTSSIRSISNTRPSSQVIALGRILPSKSKSALTSKFIFITTASFLIMNSCSSHYNMVFEKRKANKMKNR